jgi:hypothetical protein
MGEGKTFAKITIVRGGKVSIKDAVSLLWEKVKAGEAQPAFLAPRRRDRAAAAWSDFVPALRWGWTDGGRGLYVVVHGEEDEGGIALAIVSGYLGWAKKPNPYAAAAIKAVEVAVPNPSELVIPASTKEAAVTLLEKVKAGELSPAHKFPGHWDSNWDFRTGYETPSPKAFWVESPRGEGAFFVVTHEAPEVCPSGPCGNETRLTLVSVSLSPWEINWRAPVARAVI